MIERLIDHAARQFGMDQSQLRRKNFITAAQMPYTSLAGELYDTGDFDKVLARAEAEADIAGFAARKETSAKNGKIRGWVCAFTSNLFLARLKKPHGSNLQVTAR